MPLLLIAIGVVILAGAIRDRQNDLAELIKGDFSGPDSFLLWIGVFSLIYLFGKVDESGRIAKSFGILILLVMMLTKGRGFFDMLKSQISEISQAKASSYSPKTLKATK